MLKSIDCRDGWNTGSEMKAYVDVSCSDGNLQIDKSCEYNCFFFLSSLFFFFFCIFILIVVFYQVMHKISQNNPRLLR